ncbi:MAG: hypothetical protein STHCBS139747_007842 [Sporothrix thermara]
MYRLSTKAETLLETLKRVQELSVTTGHQLSLLCSPTSLEFASLSSSSAAAAAAAAAATTPTTFPSFSRLPAELQLMVWELVPQSVACQHYGHNLEDLWYNAYDGSLVHLNVRGAWLQANFHKMYAKFQVARKALFPPLTLINSLFSLTLSDEWLAFIEHEDTAEDFAWCLTPSC